MSWMTGSRWRAQNPEAAAEWDADRAKAIRNPTPAQVAQAVRDATGGRSLSSTEKKQVLRMQTLAAKAYRPPPAPVKAPPRPLPGPLPGAKVPKLAGVTPAGASIAGAGSMSLLTQIGGWALDRVIPGGRTGPNAYGGLGPIGGGNLPGLGTPPSLPGLGLALPPQQEPLGASQCTPLEWIQDPIRCSQAALPGGSAGTEIPVGGCPEGYRPNKSQYYTRAGLVRKGTKCVKRRRRNSLNPRALSRAISRVEGAKRASKRLSRITIRKKC